MVRATMSTSPLCTSGMRWAELMALNWMASGSPKMAWATWRSMSMSKPSKVPVDGLTKPIR